MPRHATRQVAIKQRSSCAVASTLDLVGDKWSLLVIRDLLHGKHTYGEILQSPPCYSAKRVAGRRLYDLARRGVAVAAEPVRVTVRTLEVVRVEGDRWRLPARLRHVPAPR